MLGPSLTARYIATLTGVVLFAAVAAVGLWAHDHADRRARALAAHVGLVLQDLGDAVEARLALGLPLGQLPEMDRLLDAARRQVPATHAVSVVDDAGRAVFSTDPVEVGETALTVPATGGMSDGHRIGDDEEVFWHPLTNDFGALAGVVLLRLPPGSVQGETVAFALLLALQLAPVLAALLAAAAALGLILARRVQPPMTAVTVVLSALNDGAGDVSVDGNVGVPASLAAPLTAFAARVNHSHRLLEQGERELGRLDELA